MGLSHAMPIELSGRFFPDKIQQAGNRPLSPGDADMCMYKIPEDTSCLGQTVEKVIGQTGFPKDIIFSCVFKEAIGSFIIPRGDTQLHVNDRVCLCGSRSDIKKAVKFLG